MSKSRQVKWNHIRKGPVFYEEHYDMIKSLVAPNNLLIYNVKDGWEPLCRFLGHPVPKTPMPRGNTSGQLVQKLDGILLYNFKVCLMKILHILGCLALMIVMYRFLRVVMHANRPSESLYCTSIK